MTTGIDETSGRAAWNGAVPAVVVLALSIAFGGCSVVPDWANPVEWYKGTRDLVTGDGAAKNRSETVATTPIPGEDKPFPKLSSVPERPARPSGESRDSMARSLAADRAAARYSNEAIRRQNESVTAPEPPEIPAAVPVNPVAPALPPAPEPAALVSPVQPSYLLPPSDEPVATSSPVASISPPGTPFPAIEAESPPAMAQEEPIVIPPPPEGERPYSLSSKQSTPPAAEGSARRFLPFDTAGQQPIVTIHFDDGSSEVDEAGQREVSRAIEFLKEQGGTLHVIGHSSSRTRNLDPLRHQLANFRISYDRAQSVARELMRQGVDPASIRISAVSDAEPAYYEVMPAGEAGNRRVEILHEK